MPTLTRVTRRFKRMVRNGGRGRGGFGIKYSQKQFVKSVSECTSCWMAKLVIQCALIQFFLDILVAKDDSSPWKISVSETHPIILGWKFCRHRQISATYNFSWTQYKSYVPWEHDTVIERVKRIRPNFNIYDD